MTLMDESSEKHRNLEGKIINHFYRGMRALCGLAAAGFFVGVGYVMLAKPLTLVSRDMRLPVASAEFNPSLGAEVYAEDGRALVVVHQGFGLQNDTFRGFRNNDEYLEYLRELDSLRESYLIGGDVVVVVEERLEYDEHAHEPIENVTYLITQPNTGIPYGQVLEDGALQPQDVDSLFERLRDAGVTTVEIAGEFRYQCAAQVATLFEGAGFQVEYSECCLYPTPTE